MATKLKARPNPIRRAIASIAPERPVAVTPAPAATRFTAYGLYKSTEGLWRLRTLEVEGDRILSFRDNEPDIRAIQVGKIAMALEGTEEA